MPHTAAFTFDGVVRFTRVGTTYLIFTILIGFAAINTGNNALYIGLTFMLGCLLLSGMASKGGLKHLVIELTDVEEAWAGRPAHGRLRIANRSRLWNVRDVVIVSDELAEPLLIPVLPKQSTSDVNASFLFRRRGVVELKTLDLYTRYPFGFFLKKRRVKIRGEVVVYPRLLAESEERERFRAIPGDELNSQRPGLGNEIHSFREYVRGDSMRHVYWKKSASLGRWIMKQTESDASRALHVAVDPFKPAGVSDEDFEQMISAATTFLYHAVQRGREVILLLPRVALHAGESQSAAPLFRALALLEASHDTVIPLMERGTVVFTLRRSDDAQTA